MGAEMTPLSDQYALGVVLYECVTGVNPFTGATSFAEVVQRVTTGDFKPASAHNPQLSRRMAAIIERAMQREPERRFSDLRAMGRELLLLAGQRTRITWGLTFNSPNSPGALARAGAVVYGGAPPQKPRGARRSWAFVPALLAVAAVGLAWRADELPRRWVDRVWSALSGPELVEASAATPPLTLALKPTPTSGDDVSPLDSEPALAAERLDEMPVATAIPTRDGVLEATSLSDVDPSLIATAPGATPAVDVLASATLASGPARSAGTSNPTATAVAQALRDGTRPRKAKTVERKKPKATLESFTLGTNNAPILD